MNVQFHYSHEVFLGMMSALEEHDFWMMGGNVNDSEEADFRAVHGDDPENIHFGECPDPDVHVKGPRPDIVVTNNRGVEAHPSAFMVYTTERKLVTDPPQHDGWMLIRKGIDPDLFDPQLGSSRSPDGPVVTTANDIQNRPRGVDSAVHDALLDASFEYRAYGHNNKDGHLPRDELASRLRGASVYANLSKTISPNALYEALAAGCPIVTVPGFGAQDAITYRYNGLLANSPEQFVAAVERLQTDIGLADRLGRRARQTALGRYHRDEFVWRWRAVLSLFE